MLHCTCGYTCGTRRALDRHLEKHAGSDEHSLSAGPPAAKPPASPTLDTLKVHVTTAAPSPRPRSPVSPGPGVPMSMSSPALPTLRTLREPSPALGQTSPLPLPLGQTSPLPTHWGHAAGDAEERRLGTPPSLLVAPSPKCGGGAARPRNSTGGFGCGPRRSFCGSSSMTSLRGIASMSASSRHEPLESLPRIPNAGGGPMLPALRLMIVRHAQSANRQRPAGESASPDPGLSERGLQQARALGEKLEQLFRADSRRAGGVPLVVSSPMRRCLLTIHPAVRRLGFGSDQCLCHGGGYEYGCAGTVFTGTSPAEIRRGFPEFKPVAFSAAHGCWDYRGANVKENEEECEARATRLVQWLCSEGLDTVRSINTAPSPPVSQLAVPSLILCTHQTFADLLCALLTEGSAAKWSYGDIRFKLNNAAITEVLVYPDGRAQFGARNFDSHCWSCF